MSTKLLTIEEFLAMATSGVYPEVKNKNDVYFLIRQGKLTAVKKDKKTYIQYEVPDEAKEAICELMEKTELLKEMQNKGHRKRNKEKKNKKKSIALKVPAIVYGFMEESAKYSNMSIEDYISKVIKNVIQIKDVLKSIDRYDTEIIYVDNELIGEELIKWCQKVSSFTRKMGRRTKNYKEINISNFLYFFIAYVLADFIALDSFEKASIIKNKKQQEVSNERSNFAFGQN